MFLSNSIGCFPAIILFLMLSTGCGVLRPAENASETTPELPKNRFPFSTKEPENFQCEIVETAGSVVRRKRVAKKGTWRRIDFDLGENNQRALLQTDKEYLLDIGRGVYAEGSDSTEVSGQFADITHELLNIGQLSEFEESSRQGSIVHYTVHPGDSVSSEILVEYDESIGMPVKQQFYSIDGAERILRFTIEMSGFQREPDPDIFSLPSNLKKVTIKELLERSLSE